VFCGAAGEALSFAEHPLNNLSALRASNRTSQFEFMAVVGANLFMG
jgi:hypothetical protein